MAAIDFAHIRHIRYTAAEAVAADTDGVHAAVTDNGSEQTITTGITDPPYPRNITATAGGVEGDIKAIQVVIDGTGPDDSVITETLPAFTVDTAGTVAGTKVFKTVTSITIPAHDDTGATTEIGFGDALWIPKLLSRNVVRQAHIGNARETTAPTVAFSATLPEGNSVDLNSALDGSVVDLYYWE